MSRYAFFGGSFNPPSMAHKTCATRIVDEMKLDKLFFVPVGDSYQKTGLINEKHRYNMLKLICEGNKKLDVYDIELNKNINFKAIDVFKIIKNNFKDDEIYYVMGADNFINILSWKNSDELIKDYKYILLNRYDINLENEIMMNDKLYKNRDNFYISNEFKKMSISSSDIRKEVRSRDKAVINELIDEKVLQYIEQNNLYL